MGNPPRRLFCSDFGLARQRRVTIAPDPCSSEDDQSAKITSNAPTTSELHRMRAFDAAPNTHGEMNTQTPMAAVSHSSHLW